MADDVALYRKYRPQAPDQILGQEHVVRALVGAVREQRLSHAFLFCGPRGTGKTSTARILAKMVNCERGPTAEPCGTCDQCVAIRDGSHLDVVEIDAASHGGVDDARELRERAPTAPAMGREKVYIIDEAQRLSREAFDALLKVFEEPPPGVRFVLATTEPHKMPPTIVGRCQRFDFRRHSPEASAEYLERIAKEEGRVLARSAAETIARQSEGSLRDALSLLDQSFVLASGEVTDETVALLFGAPQEDVQFELADAIAVGDTHGVFHIVNGLVQEGQDFRHLVGQTLGHFRDLLLVQSAPANGGILDVPPERHARLAGQAAKFATAELGRILSLLVAAQMDMRWTTSPRLTLELALVRATLPEADPSPAGLTARLERLERLAGIGDGGSAGPLQGHSPQERDAIETAPQSSPAAQGGGTRVELDEAHAPSTDVLDISTIRRSWPRLLERLRERRHGVLPAALQSVTPAAYDGASLELAFPPGRRWAVAKVQSKEEELRQAFAEVFGVTPEFRCVARDDVAGASPLEDDEPPATREDAVARLKAQLGGVVEGDSEGD